MTVSLELLSRGPARPDLVEDLVAAEADLAATLARWSAPAPVPVRSDPDLGLPSLDAVATVLADGTPALVDVAPGLADDDAAGEQLVQMLIAAAHSGVGFGSGLVPRAADAGQVWALLAGAVAAMTGRDARPPLPDPDPGALPGPNRSPRGGGLPAGAVGAMTGPDVRAALSDPDPGALLGLNRSAREAVRDVVTCVAVPAADVDRVVSDLAGSAPSGNAG